VARRPKPERLYAAHRAGLRNRLVREANVSEATAERWVFAWESEALNRHLGARTGACWEPAWAWIWSSDGERRHSWPVLTFHSG
jgi:hypothetical protein